MNELTLTAMLTTISAASASFVAILGGFIASKLLSINGERDAVAGQIANLTAQIDQKQKKEDRYRHEVNEHDAIYFIIKHIDDFYGRVELREIYDSDEKPGIDFDDMQPFWEKAVAFKEDFMNAILSGEKTDESGIPLSIAPQLKKDYFFDEVFSSLKSELWLSREERRRKSQGYSEDIFDSFPQPAIPPMTPKWYSKYCDKINDLVWEIDQLELQKKLLEQREKELNTPYGMKRGLIIFVLFSVFNIVLPLTQCNNVFKNPLCYYVVMLLFMSTFTLGLAATFCYLVSMLKWRPAAKVPVLPPEENDADEDENEEDSE